MRQYFEKMEPIGRELTDNERKRMEENVTLIKNEERVIEEAKETTKNAGIPAERINQRGENTIPGEATVILPSRESGTWPVLKRLPAEEYRGTGKGVYFD